MRKVWVGNTDGLPNHTCCDASQQKSVTEPNLPVDLIAESTGKRTQGTNQSKYVGYSTENQLVSPKDQCWVYMLAKMGGSDCHTLRFQLQFKTAEYLKLEWTLVYKMGRQNWKGLNVLVGNITELQVLRCDDAVALEAVLVRVLYFKRLMLNFVGEE